MEMEADDHGNYGLDMDMDMDCSTASSSEESSQVAEKCEPTAVDHLRTDVLCTNLRVARSAQTMPDALRDALNLKLNNTKLRLKDEPIEIEPCSTLAAVKIENKSGNVVVPIICGVVVNDLVIPASIKNWRKLGQLKRYGFNEKKKYTTTAAKQSKSSSGLPNNCDKTNSTDTSELEEVQYKVKQFEKKYHGSDRLVTVFKRSPEPGNIYKILASTVPVPPHNQYLPVSTKLVSKNAKTVTQEPLEKKCAKKKFDYAPLGLDLSSSEEEEN